MLLSRVPCDGRLSLLGEGDTLDCRPLPAGAVAAAATGDNLPASCTRLVALAAVMALVYVSLKQGLWFYYLAALVP